MRKLILLTLSLVLCGCQSKSPFKDEVEEYRYLSSLANPTPEQWLRKKEIAEHPDPSHISGTVEKAAKALDAYDRGRID